MSTEEQKTPRIEVKRPLVFTENFVVKAGENVAIEFPPGVDSRHVEKLKFYVSIGTIVLHDGAELPTIPEPAPEATVKESLTPAEPETPEESEPEAAP